MEILKAKLIAVAFKVVMGIIVLGIGIWYLSSSIGGASLTYSSTSNFLSQIGVQDGNITNANGCFLCSYIQELFSIIGKATDLFWNAIISKLWIIIAIGFGIFIIIHTINFIYTSATDKNIKNIEAKELKLDYKSWLDKIWKTGARVMVIGVLTGALGLGGTTALKTVTNITITPVMFVGAELSMSATGIIDSAQCVIPKQTNKSTDILNPVLSPFMCVIGNLNTVMLAGAAGGFALMNYSWLGLGGGLFTWLSGLALVILFLVIGFHLFFEVLSVIFKLIFVIIFAPIVLASAAFEKVWSISKGLIDKSIEMLVTSAISIIKISLKIIIIYATVSYAADSYFPGPSDGYSAILPPILGTSISKSNTDAKTLSVINVFNTCEKISLTKDGIDKTKFKECFISQKAMVERKYPGAFDFMDDGFEFFLFMLGIFFLYFWIISPKINQLLGTGEGTLENILGSKKDFDYGQWVKDVGKVIYNAPEKVYKAIAEKLKE